MIVLLCIQYMDLNKERNQLNKLVPDIYLSSVQTEETQLSLPSSHWILYHATPRESTQNSPRYCTVVPDAKVARISPC